MRAILIDPVRQLLEIRDLPMGPDAVDDKDDLEIIYEQTQCTCVTQFKLGDDMVYVDEEAMLNGAGPKLGGFRIYISDGLDHIDIAGYGLVVGVDQNGEEAPALTNFRFLKERLVWLGPEFFE